MEYPPSPEHITNRIPANETDAGNVDCFRHAIRILCNIPLNAAGNSSPVEASLIFHGITTFDELITLLEDDIQGLTVANPDFVAGQNPPIPSRIYMSIGNKATLRVTKYCYHFFCHCKGQLINPLTITRADFLYFRREFFDTITPVPAFRAGMRGR